jgi:methylaspartate mutase epsilon subunit
MKLKNKKWTEEEFLSVREEIIKSWPTGELAGDLEANVEYLKSLPKHKNFAEVLVDAKKNKKTLLQPRAGVARLQEHIELLQFLEKNGADLLPSTIDSYTRLNRYENCQHGIEESERLGRSMLNGFPCVNHGVDGCKKVLESVHKPLQARHGTPDGRLLAEIIHAAGWTSNEGGGISYNIPYAKSVSLEETIKYWQYCDRLVGYYEERGISINREPFGPLTGTIVPPCISNTVQVIEALLAAEQGVKNITVGYGQGGNVIQDIAALRALEEQTNEYLKMYGYDDMFITTVFHQWMGGFPQDEAQALGLISMASTVASLGNATKMITKTPHESFGVPTKEANRDGLMASRMVVNLLAEQFHAESDELDQEIAQIKSEVDAIIKNIIKLGDGDLAVGTVKAFEHGILDIPFAPSQQNAGKVLPARDNDGKIRIFEFGNLGVTEDIKEFHRLKLQERADFEGRKIDFNMTVDDIYAVSTGKLVGRKGK